MYPKRIWKHSPLHLFITKLGEINGCSNGTSIDDALYLMKEKEILRLNIFHLTAMLMSEFQNSLMLQIIKYTIIENFLV